MDRKVDPVIVNPVIVLAAIPCDPRGTLGLLPYTKVKLVASMGFIQIVPDRVACCSQDSPMQQLLDEAQREVVADVVNAALLASASGKPKWEVKPQVSFFLVLTTSFTRTLTIFFILYPIVTLTSLLHLLLHPQSHFDPHL